MRWATMFMFMNTTDQQRRDQRKLMLALKSNDYDNLKMIIQQKAMDLNFLDSRLSCSPLMLEVGRKKIPSIEMIQYLLDHGARINYRDRSGMSALHYLMRNKVARSSNTPCITFLLNHGANPIATDKTGDSPIHAACVSVNTNAVRCLLVLCNDNRDQSSYLQNRGMMDDNIHTIDVNCTNNAGDTPLMLATNSNSLGLELVEILFEYNAEINLLNKKNCSALHFAAQNGSSKVVDLLLHRGADVNNVNSEDITPLECVCLGKNAKSIQSLLSFHADVNRQNRKLRTPLHLLAEVRRWSSCRVVDRCLRFLVIDGANVNIQDLNGETPLSYSVRLCLSTPCWFQQEGMMSQIELLLDFKESKSINNQLCKYIDSTLLVIGDTILHYAVKYMNVDMVKLILHHNPDLRIRNCHHETPRDVAIKLVEDGNRKKKIIIELIEKKMEHSRVQSYSYMLQSWMMSDGEQEPLHQKKRLHGMTNNVSCPPSKKTRKK